MTTPTNPDQPDEPEDTWLTSPVDLDPDWLADPFSGGVRAGAAETTASAPNPTAAPTTEPPPSPPPPPVAPPPPPPPPEPEPEPAPLVLPQLHEPPVLTEPWYEEAAGFGGDEVAAFAEWTAVIAGDGAWGDGAMTTAGWVRDEPIEVELPMERPVAILEEDETLVEEVVEEVPAPPDRVRPTRPRPSPRPRIEVDEPRRVESAITLAVLTVVVGVIVAVLTALAVLVVALAIRRAVG